MSCLLRLACWCGLVFALPAWSMGTLAEGYQTALRSDRVFLAAAAQHRSVLEKVPQARAGLLPTINANVNRTNNDAQVNYADTRFAGIDRQYLVNGWSVTLTQPLFRLANLLQYDRAHLQVEQSFIQLEVARKDLLVRYVRALLDWQSAQRNVEAAEMTQAHLRLAQEQARSAAKLKLMSVPDLLETEARCGKAEADVEVASGELKAKLAALAKIVGGGVPSGRFIFGSLPAPLLKDGVQAWIDQAKEQNALVRAHVLQLAIMEKDIAAARAGHLPTLNLVASKGHTFNSGSTSIVDGSSANTQNQVAVGLQLEIPLFSGGLVNSRVDEAAAMRDRVKEELENARETAAVDVQTYYYKAISGVARIEAAAQRVRASESQLAAASAGRALNVKLEVDVLAARAALVTAQRELFSAQAETMLAVLQLRQASGALGDDDAQTWARVLAFPAVGTHPERS